MMACRLFRSAYQTFTSGRLARTGVSRARAAGLEVTRALIANGMIRPWPIAKCAGFRKLASRSIGLLLLAIGLSAAHAHTTDAFLPLQYRGYFAPFGDDQTETYTEVWSENDVGFLGSLASGVAIVDLSDASQLTTQSVYGANLGQSFHDVRTDGALGYFSTHGTGTHIVDLSTASSPVEIARVTSATQGFDTVTNATLYGTRLGTHLGAYLIQVSQTSGEIAITDVTDPATPSLVARLDTGDSVGIYDVTVAGNRLFAAGLGGAAGEGATYIYDLENLTTTGASLVAQIATGANTASAWPGADGSTLMTTQRKAGGGLTAWDISDPTMPTQIDAVDASDFGVNAYSAAQLFVLDGAAYTAWHQAGVQVVDLDILEQTDIIYRVGAFGTTQASPLEGFVGNTSVHAEDHDQVLLADSRWGLFLVDATNVITSRSSLTGDINESGTVDSSDLGILLNNFGNNNGLPVSAGNLNGDPFINSADLGLLLNNFGATTSLASVVPEPGGVWMMLLTALGCFRWRRTHRSGT